jgi:pantetheine-phosphate adenylyltransferase
MKTRTAVYPGSFDPITKGHLNIIERVSPLYDKLIVVVSKDLNKKYMFTAEERVRMIESSVSHLPNVKVTTLENFYLARHAVRSLRAEVIIRGIRNGKDLDEEQTLAVHNRNIEPGLETLFVPCLPEFAHISSSAIKSHIEVDFDWLSQVTLYVPAAVVRMFEVRKIVDKAKKHWEKLMQALGNPKVGEEIFQDLLQKYTEPHRYYHNLRHIVSMLDEFETMSSNADSEDLAKFHLAIWYHDYIYETDTKDHSVIGSNEARSAYHAAIGMTKLGVSKEIIRRVCNQDESGMIMTTQHKAQPEGVSQRLLVDLDLSILGKPDAEFDEYETAIRAEYSHVPDLVFREVRKKILQSFLDRKQIYSTFYFRETYEEQARKNIARSIAKLS